MSLGTHEMTYLQRLHEVRLDSILHEDGKSTSNAEVVSSDRLAALASRDNHRTQTLTHVRETCRERKDGHALASNRDVEAGDALVALLSRGLANGDLTEEAVVGVEDAVPGDGLRVNVEAGETVDFLGRELVRVRLVNAELLETLEHERSELALALLGRDETAVEGLGSN